MDDFALENIRGRAPIDNPDYRYKMPCLQSDIESRRTGIVTVISNAALIVEAIQRPMSHIAKYLAIHLGVRAWHHVGRNVVMVRGMHARETLAHILYGYIECYVLCPACRLPEATLVFRWQNGLVLRCSSCHAQSAVQDGTLSDYIRQDCGL
jgi:translation initiation factor 5